MPTECPTDSSLRSFATLAPDQATDDDLLNHLMGCAPCQQRLDRLAGQMELPTPPPLEPVPTAPDEAVEYRLLAQRILTGLRGPLVHRQGLAGGRYRVNRSLGAGGMGEVFEATDTGLNRLVAIKTLRPGTLQPDRLARLREEAAALANLRHPNIVQVLEWNETDGLPWMAMEFVPGQTLAERLKRGPLEPRDAAALLATLARAMHHAHSLGLVHRDLKPSNILLARPDRAGATGSDGDPARWPPKIIDFGLSKWFDGDTGLTHPATLVGTPAYMAPEQAGEGRQEVGPRCDIYSLGAVLYQCLTGQPPFPSDSVANTLRLIQFAEPAAPRFFNRRIPRDLETICLKCLHKQPSGRYLTAGELADDLERHLAGRPIIARPAGTLERLWRWTRRNPWLSAAMGLAAVSLAAVVALAWANAWRENRLRLLADAQTDRANEMVEELLKGYRSTSDSLLETTMLLRLSPEAANNPATRAVREQLIAKSWELIEEFRKHPDPEGRYADWLAENLIAQIILCKDAGDLEGKARAERIYLEVVAPLANPPRNLVNMELLTANAVGEEELRSRRERQAVELWAPIWTHRLHLPDKRFQQDADLLRRMEKLAVNLADVHEKLGDAQSAATVRRQWEELRARVRLPKEPMD